MPCLNLRRARVVAVDSQDGGAQFVQVTVGEKVEKAVNYLALGRAVAPGQRCCSTPLPSTWSWAAAVTTLFCRRKPAGPPGGGHQMKLRYTPLQVQVDCAEEQGSPWHDLFKTPHGLAGIPVLAASCTAWCRLHSSRQGFGAQPELRVCTDGGSLVAFSRNVRALRELGAIVAVITACHSFGGFGDS